MLNGKYEVVLFQPYLRKFVLNFGKYLSNFVFINVANPPITGGGYHNLPSFENEVARVKTTWRNRLRRILGVPNIRPYFKKKGDLLFTYGCLLVTLKPYCTYIETGLALYNYDLGIANNPLAKFIISLLATRNNCKKLIFVSEAAKKSFFSSINYGVKVQDILMRKSIVIYPIPSEEQGTLIPKHFTGALKLLFPGTFYMKGGMEVAHAYERLRQKYQNISLTIITATHMLQKNDLQYLHSLSGLTLLDAKLNERQMAEMYQTHDILLLPTYREGFGLVLVEALSYGMPLIITDQYATKEMAQEEFNGLTYPNPLRDYDPQTYQMFGKYYNPKDFYAKLFFLQRTGQLKPIEDFLTNSIERFLNTPSLLEEFSRNSISIYNSKFKARLLSERIEAVFLESLQN